MSVVPKRSEANLPLLGDCVFGQRVGRSRGAFIGLCALAFLALPAVGANATTLTSFQVTVTSISDPDLLLTGVTLGGTISGILGVDESATDRDASPTLGDYGGAVFSLELTLGAQTFSVTASPAVANFIRVEDDAGGVDTYVARLVGASSGDAPTSTTDTFFFLMSSNLTLLSGDALPASIPGSSGADWDALNSFQVIGTEGASSYQINGTLDSFAIVPEPSTGALCLLGLIALGSRSRSTRTTA
jgi:hypothetical protein